MSTLSVDKVEPVGSTLTFGESGDTFVIPAGATFTNSGTSTGFASVNTHVSQWRLTANFTGNAIPLITNLVEVSSPVGYGKLPASAPMTKDGFGKFTFPVTGTWYLIFSAFGGTANYDDYEADIRTTTNNSTYTIAAVTGHHNINATQWFIPYVSCMFNVTDTTQCKCDFNLTYSDAAVTTRGDADKNETYITFIRLGDSL